MAEPSQYSSDVPILSFPSITYYDFSIIPTEFYFVEDKYPVVIYEIKHQNTTTKIPYYMSNGESNGLRANMLFPFICFNLNDIDHPECPVSTTHKTTGLIYKYMVCENMNLNKLHNQIVSELQPSEYTDTRNHNILLSLAQLNNVSLYSVLDGRLNNLLDFLISICSKKILDIVEPVREELFVPIYDKQIPKINHFLMDSVGLIKEGETPGVNDYILTNSIHQPYRVALIKMLNQILMKLKEKIKIEFVEKKFSELEKKRYVDFNEKHQVCSKHDNIYDINKDFILNFSSYKELSKKLYELLDIRKRDSYGTIIETYDTNDIVYYLRKNSECYKNVREILGLWDLDCSNINRLDDEIKNNKNIIYINLVSLPKMDEIDQLIDKLIYLFEIYFNENNLSALKKSMLSDFIIKLEKLNENLKKREAIKTNIYDNIRSLSLNIVYLSNHENKTRILDDTTIKSIMLDIKHIYTNLYNSLSSEYLTKLIEKCEQQLPKALDDDDGWPEGGGIIEEKSVYYKKYIKYKLKYLSLKTN
jgi:hypothetical protein